MKSFSFGLILGSIAPAVGIYLLGGSSLACFVYGALLAILPTVWVTRFFCPRKVVQVEAPAPVLSVPASVVAAAAGPDLDIESALLNFGCSKKKARAIASQVPASGDFNSRLRTALQLSRSMV